MATWSRTRLLAAAIFFLLALLPWSAQGGTQDAPEITDAVDDHTLGGAPLEGVGQFINADIVAAWIEDAGADLLLVIQLQGSAAPTSTTNYDYTFHMEVAGTAYEATGALGAAAPVGTGTIAPGGVATAATNGGSRIVLTVPKDAIGAISGATVTGLFVEAVGTPVSDPASVVEDRAPNEGVGLDYVVTGGDAGGDPGDADADGLNDTWETEQFGNVTLHNGTGDPDGDGLNNSAEFAAGTNATNPDTDGDFLQDGEDPLPLDATQPADFDGDGLTDSWERTHFTALNAQNGTGDPDDDGLNNTRELALGTDPNKADTDGDGVADGKDSAPLDPAVSRAAPAASTGRKARPELYAGAAMFAAASTFILLGLARGI